MGDWASIILRYNMVDDREDSGYRDEVYKGVICNHYRGYDPFGMVSRFANGLDAFVCNVKKIPYFSRPEFVVEDTDQYQWFRRMFDVDFEYPSLVISRDSVAYTKREFREGNITREKFNEKLLWCDSDFGQLLIDVAGSFGKPIVKYAYVSNIYEPEKNYTVEEYINRYKLDKLREELQPAVDYVNGAATYMALAEIQEFIDTDLYEYAFFNELAGEWDRERTKESPRPVDEMTIEDLKLSIKTYICLKQNGIHTVKQLMEMSEEQVKACGDMIARRIEKTKKELDQHPL